MFTPVASIMIAVWSPALMVTSTVGTGRTSTGLKRQGTTCTSSKACASDHRHCTTNAVCCTASSSGKRHEAASIVTASCRLTGDKEACRCTGGVDGPLQRERTVASDSQVT